MNVGESRRMAEPRRKSAPASFFAGSCSGIVTALALQPLEVVKTNLQANSKIEGGFRGMRTVMKDVVRRGGVRALWGGATPAALRVGLGVGLYFCVLESAAAEVRRRWPDTGEQHPWTRAAVMMALGSGSRNCAAVLLCPVTVIKTRMEHSAAQGVRYKSMLGAAESIVRTGGGVRALYAGLGMTLLRDVPYSGLYLALYTHLRDSAAQSGVEGLDRSSPAVTLTAGALAGALATLATHPPDVLRARRQLQSRAYPVRGAADTGLPTTLAGVIKHEGYRGLYRGSLPRVLRRSAQQALTWTLYEQLASAYERTFERPPATSL
mmetsp:Transcript_30370/g.98742  ORF Transcript_30370/g.98742 Transcript_30370/m.98742 type:complete len:322 (-) Transcript_30370:7-972(-)